MKFNLKRPCKDCPYTNQVPVWIGPYESAAELHEFAAKDIEFFCHNTQDNKERSHCCGNALYMNQLCKQSRDPEMAAYQRSLSMPEDIEILGSLDGSKIVEFHGR